jgi:FKBP-type peptidyl-prolyl cis-trans isomerase (trigger factor)
VNEYKIVSTKNLPHSEVEIEAEITAEYVESFWKQAIAHIGEHVEIAGFRKGNIPETVLLSKVGEMTILEEASEMALSDVYPKIIVEKKINAIGRPKVTITKMAKGNPLVFKAITAVVPEIKLPNYKKIAKEIIGKQEEVVVTDQDIENVITEIRKSKAPHDHDTELPEFNDELVKSLGADFTSVEDFKTKARERILAEKKYRTVEKKRIEILDGIADKTTTDLPELLIESELEKTNSQFVDNLKSMGLEIVDYLKRIEKTEDDLRKEWRPEAEKRAKIQLVLNQIALEEKIETTKEEIEKEVKHLLEHYKDADPERAKMHAENVLTNEKVFQFLENQN